MTPVNFVQCRYLIRGLVHGALAMPCMDGDTALRYPRCGGLTCIRVAAGGLDDTFVVSEAASPDGIIYTTLGYPR
jgi:hypothetical protein